MTLHEVADQLNATLAEAEAVFVQTFKGIPAGITFEDKCLTLRYQKVGSQYGLWVEDGAGALTNIRSVNLETRMRAAGMLDELFAACQKAEAEAIVNIQGATKTVADFVTRHRPDTAPIPKKEG